MVGGRCVVNGRGVAPKRSATCRRLATEAPAFLRDKQSERVGDARTRIADVSVIYATNVDLAAAVAAAVAAGEFRPDLYYRVNVIATELPPLRLTLAEVE